MKIAIPLAGTDAGRSGLGTWVRAVLPRLVREAREHGAEILAIGTPHDLEAYADILEGAEQVSLPRWARRPSLSAGLHLLAIDRLAQKHGATVLLFPAGNRRFVCRPSLPTVSVIHDLAALHVPRKFGLLRDLWVTRVLPWALRATTKVVAISEATRNDLRGLLGAAVAVQVVPNGVEAERFAASPELTARAGAARERLGLHRPYLLYPARLEHPGKNHVRLVRAFAQSHQSSSHDLVLVGADWGAKKLIETTIHEVGAEDRVRILGFVERPELEALIAGAAAVAAVGLHEGFGLPVLEALAAGRPTLVVRAGALPEVVGDFGVITDPHDVPAMARDIDRVLGDSRVHSHASADGPRWASRQSWTNVAQRLFSLCEAAS